MDVAQRLERSQWDFFWTPDDARIHDRPELLYVSCPRDLPFLNVVTRSDPDASDLEGLIAEVTSAHAQVRSRWAVPDRIATPRLHRALEAASYVTKQEHHVRAIPTGDFRPRPAADCEVVHASTVEHLRDLIAVGNAAFGKARSPSNAELEEELAQCLDPDGRVHRFVVYTDGRPVAGGGINAFDDLQLGFLWAGATIPEARGKGYYSAVVAERIAWARRRGLEWVGLYAITTTSSPIVERQGFGKHGTMTYWERRHVS